MKNIFKQFRNPFKVDYATRLVDVANDNLYDAKMALIKAKHSKIVADANLAYLEKHIISLKETVSLYEGEKYAKENSTGTGDVSTNKQTGSPGYRIPLSSQ